MITWLCCAIKIVILRLYKYQITSGSHHKRLGAASLASVYSAKDEGTSFL
jgi:hypothetical protein